MPRRARLTASIEELDQARLESRYEGVGSTPIDEAPLRQPVRVAGEVRSVTFVPRASSPTLEVSISDGTGKAVAVFLGRRRIGGLSPGRGILLEGILQQDHSRLVLINPVYLLLD